MALRIGVDLCDDYTVISVAGEDEVTSMPTVICRDKKKEYWHIGEEAYRMALSGKGVLTDKLVSLLKKDGRSTVGDRTYSSVELCTEFLRFALKEALGDRELKDIEGLCLVLHKADPELMDRASEAVAALGLPEGSFRISSHEEALIHYILPKEKELYNNLVAVFDLSEEVFSYYEFRVIRGVGRQTVMCSGTDLEEAFHIDVLKTDSGRKLADHIIAECARKLMDRKIYSSVFLTGKGFSDTEWAEEFKEFICKRRRVIFEEGMSARDRIYDGLCAEGIYPRKYFYPCINAFACYRGQMDPDDTPVAKRMSESVLTLPIYPELPLSEVERICSVLKRLL